MPPLACSKRPMRRSVAPVNAPFSWPNSSDSSSSAAIAEVFSATNGAVGARRVVVQRARDELLAGAGLARDQHGHARARQPPDRLEHLLHRRRLTDDARRRLRRSSAPAAAAAALPRRARDELDRFVDVERLRQILERAALVGGHGAVEIRVRRDHDDGNVGIRAREPLHELEAAHVGHADVGDQHVGPAVLERVEEFLAGLEGAREHVGLLQRLLEHPPHGLVVVDDPNGQSGRCHQRRPPFGDRQTDLKDRATRLARELDEPPIAAHEVLRDREPEPRARGTPRHERIEDRLLELVGNAGAVVLDFGGQHQPMALAADREIRQRARAEDQPAALAERLHRIAPDVEECLNHLVAIDRDRRQARVVVAHELDARRASPPR